MSFLVRKEFNNYIGDLCPFPFNTSILLQLAFEWFPCTALFALHFRSAFHYLCLDHVTHSLCNLWCVRLLRHCLIYNNSSSTDALCSPVFFEILVIKQFKKQNLWGKNVTPVHSILWRIHRVLGGQTLWSHGHNKYHSELLLLFVYSQEYILM